MGNAIAGTSDKVIVGEGDDGYVHIFDAATGIFLSTIGNPDLPADEGFGDAVGALGDNILIGATNDAFLLSGSVSVYSGNLVVLNNPPIAVDDVSVATNDTPITVDVLNNDSDPDGHSLIIDSVNFLGAEGIVTNNGNDVAFTANLNFDGDTTFSYKISDGNGGLSNAAIVTVSVSDTFVPVITLFGDNPQIIEVGSGYVELGATIDDGSPLTIDISEFTDAVGSYMIHYDSTDVNGNVATTVIRTVNVVDTTSLIITAPADQTFEATAVLTPLSESDYGTATATDDNDPNPTITSDAPNVFPLGSTTIIWTATNSFGNSATDIQIITVQDTTDPILTLLGDNPQTIELGNSYSELGATALDTTDGVDNLYEQSTMEDDFSISIDQQFYFTGDSLTVLADKGNVFQILDPDFNPVLISQGSSPYTVVIGGPLWEKSGQYTAIVSSGSDVAQTTFFVNVEKIELADNERISIQNQKIANAFGDIISDVNSGQQVQITADISNNQNFEQEFAYVITTQNSNIMSEPIWITGILASYQELTLSLSWTPEYGGVHIITIQIWNNPLDKLQISQDTILEINVEGDQNLIIINEIDDNSQPDSTLELSPNTVDMFENSPVSMGEDIFVVDDSGNKIDKVSTDQTIDITTTISNDSEYEQKFVFIVQIKDSDGFIVSIDYVEDTLIKGTSLTPSLSLGITISWNIYL